MVHVEEPFLFMFGFESPAEHISNERDGTDFESSWAVRIFAENTDAALAWGRRIAEEFVRRLFEQAGVPVRSWIEDGFAHCISDDASGYASSPREEFIQTVNDGQMPDFSWALNHWTR